MITLTQAEARKRLVTPEEMVSCPVAFVDCRLPGSHLKQNYSFIGPGVTQSASQVVNIPEPHSFNIGAAAMPKGVTNNLHLHFTAEVFLIHEGSWKFRWGAAGEHEAVFSAPTILTIPTWIFRGFTNVSPNETDGWVFTVLGGDNTGGIIWHPSVLEAAQETGLYLGRDNKLIDTEAGAPTPERDQLMPAISAEEMARLPQYTPQQMAQYAVTGEQRAWSSRALLDSCLPGHGGRLAPVIGYGVNQDRTSITPIVRPHGFSVEWASLENDHQWGNHCCDQTQVIMVFKGELEVTFNRGGEAVTLRAPEKSVVSIPAHSWRHYRAINGDCEFTLTSAGDERTKIWWDDAILTAAQEQGWCVDPDGWIAPWHLLPVTARRAGAALAHYPT